MPSDPGESGLRLQHLPAGVGGGRRTGGDAGAVCLHHRTAVRLAVVGDAHHVHLAVDAQERAGHRQRAAPLSGAGLGGELRHPFLPVVERLRHRRVGLVRADRRDALVLVVEARGGIELPFQAPRPEQRRRAPQPVYLSDRLRNRYLPLPADLLLDQRQCEQRRQVIGTDRVHPARMDHRRQRFRQVGLDVVPGGGNLGLRQIEANRLHRFSLSYYHSAAAGHDTASDRKGSDRHT